MKDNPKCTTCKHCAYCPAVRDSERKDKSKCYEMSESIKKVGGIL